MLTIKEIKIGNKKIKQCPLAEQGILPSHPFRSYIIGASGSGKTNLLLNLLTRDHYYKDYFDRIFIISPTALGLDQSYKELEKKTKYINGKDLLYFECDESVLKGILDLQEEEKKAKKALVIMDDIVSYGKFCRSNELLQFGIMSRHYNISMFILSQAFHLIPKSVRLNMSSIYYFKGSAVETETLVEQYCPAGYRKKDFQGLVDEATEGPYSFLFIDLNVPMHSKTPRYRRNLTDDLLVGSRKK